MLGCLLGCCETFVPHSLCLSALRWTAVPLLKGPLGDSCSFKVYPQLAEYISSSTPSPLSPRPNEEPLLLHRN